MTPDAYTLLCGLAWCVGFLLTFNLHRIRK